jgi:sugar (pentulose or hexulose) kinase
MQVLALDVGTSSVKAAILDVATAMPLGAVARASYTLDYPTPDAAEVPAERLWSAVAAAARGVATAGQHIDAIGLSCLTPALVLLDDADRPLAPIWTHLDRRARPAARQVWAEVGEEFLATVGGAEIVRRLIPGYQGAAVHLLKEGSLRGVARLFDVPEP